MRETAERLVRLDPRRSAKETVDQLEQEAMMMRARGWWYCGNRVDELCENVALFFERDLDDTTPFEETPPA